MKALYLERSTGECRDGKWVERLDLGDIGRIVVGTGPGSFAGIRSALAFAQGFSLGRSCEVLGLPSACAIAAQVYRSDPQCRRLAVVGDSRRGMAWVALFEGFDLVREVFQVPQSELAAAVPAECPVTTPDDKRLDAVLRETFGARYMGGTQPTSEGLRLFAEANPAVLSPEPLPIYLNPAVRP